jgi:hypothetical protein
MTFWKWRYCKLQFNQEVANQKPFLSRPFGPQSLTKKMTIDSLLASQLGVGTIGARVDDV